METENLNQIDEQLLSEISNLENIEIIEDSFLYEIEDIFNFDDNLLTKFIIYQKGYNFYLEIKDKISSIKLGNILENSKIIYGKQAKKIKKESKIIKK